MWNHTDRPNCDAMCEHANVMRVENNWTEARHCRVMGRQSTVNVDTRRQPGRTHLEPETLFIYDVFTSAAVYTYWCRLFLIFSTIHVLCRPAFDSVKYATPIRGAAIGQVLYGTVRSTVRVVHDGCWVILGEYSVRVEHADVILGEYTYKWYSVHQWYTVQCTVYKNGTLYSV